MARRNIVRQARKSYEDKVLNEVKYRLKKEKHDQNKAKRNKES